MNDDLQFPIIRLTERTSDFGIAGPGGNPFAVIGTGKTWLREVGEKGLQSRFVEEATSGDYLRVLATMDKWFATELVEAYQGMVDCDDDYDL